MVPTALPPTVAVITEFSGALPDQGLTWNARERSGGDPQAALLTHCQSAAQPPGAQVRVWVICVTGQGPPHAISAQVPQEQPPVHEASATHWLWARQLAGLQVRVCWRWVAVQPPAAQEPLVQAPQEQDVHEASATHWLWAKHLAGLQVRVC